MERFSTIVQGQNPLNIAAKLSILDDWGILATPRERVVLPSSYSS